MRTKYKKINKKTFFLLNRYLLKDFTYGNSKRYSGRNRQGKLILRHRGGGLKHKTRCLDLYRKIVNQRFLIINICFDSARRTQIATAVALNSGLMFNMICPSGLTVGKLVWSRENVYDYDRLFSYKRQANKLGCSMPLRGIPNGLEIHMVESYPRSGAKLARSPGNFAKIIRRKEFKGVEYVCLKLPSKTEKYVRSESFATIGRVSGVENKQCSFRKAGRSRRLGLRPKVRGVAMNPVDHPHGGGEGKSSGGRISVSRWGKLTKGFKTTRAKLKSHKRKLFSKVAYQKQIKKRVSIFY